MTACGTVPPSLVPERKQALSSLGALGSACRAHTAWSSGQDQCATIKRQLQLVLPTIRVFLDVDDLDAMDRLETYVAGSQSILLFLSRSYFFSAACQREIRVALTQKKPLVLLHEANHKRGGAALDTIIDECRADWRDALFNAGREVVQWHRVQIFQTESIKCIAAQLLHASPAYNHLTSPPAVTVRGEAAQQRLNFPRHCLLYASPHNPGAEAAMRELESSFNSELLRVTADTPRQLQAPLALRAGAQWMNRAGVGRANGLLGRALGLGHTESTTRLRRSSSTRGDGSHRDDLVRGDSMSRSLSRATSFMDRLKRALVHNRVTHLVLYLNEHTFVGNAGSELAREVRLALEMGLPIFLVHEVDAARDGVEFERMFRTTPHDLIQSGLYSPIAVPFHSGVHRAVSFAVAAKALGARERTFRMQVTNALTDAAASFPRNVARRFGQLSLGNSNQASEESGGENSFYPNLSFFGRNGKSRRGGSMSGLGPSDVGPMSIVSESSCELGTAVAPTVTADDSNPVASACTDSDHDEDYLSTEEARNEISLQASLSARRVESIATPGSASQLHSAPESAPPSLPKTSALERALAARTVHNRGAPIDTEATSEHNSECIDI